jgi:hypothetical protein
MMILPPTMYDGRGSGHGRHDLRLERPDPIGMAMMRLHPVEAAQTFGSLLGHAFQAVFQRTDRRSATTAR